MTVPAVAPTTAPFGAYLPIPTIRISPIPLPPTEIRNEEEEALLAYFALLDLDAAECASGVDWSDGPMLPRGCLW